MGRPRKYTARTLKKAVQEYFDSITREVEVTEKVDSGERDSKGHIIYVPAPVLNKLGKPAIITEYIVPPTVGGLCEFLGIHRSTWAEYCDETLHPEFSDTTTRTRGRMRDWREEQLLVRKDVKGIIFDLQNNYGYSEKREIEFGERAGRTMTAAAVPIAERQALLAELARQFAQEGDEDEPAEG